MFDDLDASLAAVLDDAAAPTEVRTADVSFVVPDKDFTPGQLTLNLFLHEVQENRALRDDASQRRHLNGVGWTFQRAPLRVDCTYLVTAWSSKTGGLKAAEEHRLLGRTLLWLGRFPVIPETYLQGTLAAPPQPFPLAAAVAQTREGQSMGEFWTALGVAPRPAFSLTVTVALQPFTESDTYPELTAVQLRTGLVTDPVLRGRVLDEASAGIAGASVRLVEPGLVVSTDPSGAFSFAGVPFGTYTLTVQSAGHSDASRSLDYEQGAQVHDVILTGP